jgi:hypothetical protein
MSERRFKVFEERRLLFTHTAAPPSQQSLQPILLRFQLSEKLLG